MRVVIAQQGRLIFTRKGKTSLGQTHLHADIQRLRFSLIKHELTQSHVSDFLSTFWLSPDLHRDMVFLITSRQKKKTDESVSAEMELSRDMDADNTGLRSKCSIWSS